MTDLIKEINEILEDENRELYFVRYKPFRDKDFLNWVSVKATSLDEAKEKLKTRLGLRDYGKIVWNTLKVGKEAEAEEAELFRFKEKEETDEGYSEADKKKYSLYEDDVELNEDAIEARELLLYIENDTDLYRQRHLPIIKNLKRKLQKDIFIPEKALISFRLLAREGAKKYNTDFGSKDGDYKEIFSKEDIGEVAKDLLQSLMDEWETNKLEGF